MNSRSFHFLNQSLHELLPPVAVEANDDVPLGLKGVHGYFKGIFVTDGPAKLNRILDSVLSQLVLDFAYYCFPASLLCLVCLALTSLIAIWTAMYRAFCVGRISCPTPYALGPSQPSDAPGDGWDEDDTSRAWKKDM
jgi:hypothetical protein